MQYLFKIMLKIYCSVQYYFYTCLTFVRQMYNNCFTLKVSAQWITILNKKQSER